MVQRIKPLPLSATVMPFGEYEGLTFDQIPLSYLDWLSGQDWLWGELRHRLTLYINRPVIWRILEEQFQDPDLKPSEFDPCGYLSEPDKWHGQTMPKEKVVPKPVTWWPGWKESWNLILDFLCFLESSSNPKDSERVVETTDALPGEYSLPKIRHALKRIGKGPWVNGLGYISSMRRQDVDAWIEKVAIALHNWKKRLTKPIRNKPPKAIWKYSPPAAACKVKPKARKICTLKKYEQNGCVSAGYTDGKFEIIAY